MGIGTWLLPEGYMWKLSPGAESPRQIEALFVDLVGPEAAQRFWDRFRANFFNEDDVGEIAECGFDHIRLPINARVIQTEAGEPIEAGLALIDQTIEWCRRHRLWLLLDLHGAPGGQTGTNIDDSPNNKPELFMDPNNRALTIKLWEMLARRYRDETVVMGYDLLNEPLPNEWQHVYREELATLYKELTAAIRSIDQQHLIMYEGSHWATNWEIFTEVWDPNSVLQFHRYWMAPDRASIAPYLAAREQLGLPIYMGEGGENTPAWIYAATRLYERHDIGWNLWPWKKLDTLTSPLSMRVPAGWDLIADPEAQIDAGRAAEILDDYLAAAAADACTVRTPVLDALFARAPLTLPGWAGARHGEPALADTMSAPMADAVWDRPSGAPYADGESPGAVLAPGDALRFAFAERPGDWQVVADHPGSVDARWNDGHVVVTAHAPAVVHAVSVRP